MGRMEIVALMSVPAMGVAAAFAVRRAQRRPWTTVLLAVSAAIAVVFYGGLALAGVGIEPCLGDCYAVPAEERIAGQVIWSAWLLGGVTAVACIVALVVVVAVRGSSEEGPSGSPKDGHVRASWRGLPDLLTETTLADVVMVRGPLLALAGELALVGSSLALLISLFLPWYEPFVAQRVGVDGSLNAWEAFASVDVLLSLLATYGLGSVLAVRRFSLPVAYVPVPLVSWIGVALILFAYFRPAALGGPAFFPGPPGIGFLVAFAAAGAMTGSSLVALLARDRS